MAVQVRHDDKRTCNISLEDWTGAFHAAADQADLVVAQKSIPRDLRCPTCNKRFKMWRISGKNYMFARELEGTVGIVAVSQAASDTE